MKLETVEALHQAISEIVDHVCEASASKNHGRVRELSVEMTQLIKENPALMEQLTLRQEKETRQATLFKTALEDATREVGVTRSRFLQSFQGQPSIQAEMLYNARFLLNSLQLLYHVASWPETQTDPAPEHHSTSERGPN